MLSPVVAAQVVESVLKDEAYDDDKVTGWIDQICDGCNKSLIELNRPFKYIGTQGHWCMHMWHTPLPRPPYPLLRVYCFASIGNYHAEEWRWGSRGTLVLVGQRERQCGPGIVAACQCQGTDQQQDVSVRAALHCRTFGAPRQPTSVLIVYVVVAGTAL